VLTARALQGLEHGTAGSTRKDGACEHDELIAVLLAKGLADCLHRLEDVVKREAAMLVARSRDDDECRIGPSDRVHGIGRRGQARPSFGEELCKLRLIDRRPAVVDRGDIRVVDVYADGRKALGGETRRHRRAELAEADHRNPHVCSPCGS
jgi:hypothetical protein